MIMKSAALIGMSTLDIPRASPPCAYIALESLNATNTVVAQVELLQVYKSLKICDNIQPIILQGKDAQL